MSYAEPSVLIVDDERLNIDLMVDLLKPHYRTLVATNGEQTLKRASGEPRPDILLLDVMMPEMDGYEVCRRLKADAATSHIPVIFVTAMSEVGDEGLRPGCRRLHHEAHLPAHRRRATCAAWP
jgi:CheY-like chemotaxis protein